MIRGWFLPPSITSNEEVVVEINVNTVLINQNIKRKVWNYQKNLLTLRIKKKMEDNLDKELNDLEKESQQILDNIDTDNITENDLINIQTKLDELLSKLGGVVNKNLNEEEN
jgi:hypothetical protein